MGNRDRYKGGSRWKTVFVILFSLTYCLLPIAHRLSFAQGSLEEERLNIIKSDIQKEIEYNNKLKKELSEARKDMDENTKERLLKVSKMYESMPPEDAARKLEKIDEDTAVAILSALKPKTAGKILAQMENDKAASLSKKIIMQSKSLPEKTSR